MTVDLDDADTLRTRADEDDECGPLELILLGEQVYSRHGLPVTGHILIGRAPDCEIVVDDESVSRRHARIDIGPPLTVCDQGSANGTRVQGKTLRAGVRVEFAIGEAVQIGTVMAVVRAGTGPVRRRRLWPHSYFEGRVDEECEVCARAAHEFTVVRARGPIELDGAAVVDALAPVLRAGDVVGQIAPGDFEIMLRALPAGDAAAVVDRIAAAVAAVGAPVAIGHACFPQHGRSAGELLAAAAALAGAAIEPADDGAWRDVLRLADRAAASSLGVLIVGEAGVGKSRLAEHIHRQSPRRDRPLVRLDCAEPPGQLEVELPAVLEAARGGSLILEAVGELPAPVQVMLTGALESRAIERPGGMRTVAVDVRILATSERQLADEIDAGRFRAELSRQVAAMTLVIPPLRQRVREIARLARRFAGDAAGELGLDPVEVSADAIASLERHAWPGNLRELRDVIARAAALSTTGAITPSQLPPEIATGAERSVSGRRWSRASSTPPWQGTIRDSVRKTVAEVERKAIIDALARHGGNQHAAARELGIHRRTLMRRLDQYGIPRPRKGSAR